MGQTAASEKRAKVETQIKKYPVLLYCTTTCGYCTKAKSVLDIMKVKSHSIYLDKDPDGLELAQGLFEITHQDTVPCIFIATKHIGGFSQLLSGIRSGFIQSLMKNASIYFEDITFN